MKQRILSAVAALVLFGCLLPLKASAEMAQDITHLFRVTQSPPVFDRVNRIYYSYVDLTNISGATVAGRMRLVVTDSTLPVSDMPTPPDGTTYDGKPFYWLGEGDQTYAPGASSGNRRVNFQLQRVRLSYGVRVEIMAEAAALVPPEGGTISSPTGVFMSVPSGALQNSALITMEGMPVVDEIGGVPVIGGIEFGPSGLVFNEPVACLMSIAQPLTPGELVDVLILNESAQALEGYQYPDGSPAYGIVTDDGLHVAFLVSHFSTYFASRVGTAGGSRTYDVGVGLDGSTLIKLWVPLNTQASVVLGDLTELPPIRGLVGQEYRQEVYVKILRDLVLQTKDSESLELINFLESEVINPIKATGSVVDGVWHASKINLDGFVSNLLSTQHVNLFDNSIDADVYYSAKTVFSNIGTALEGATLIGLPFLEEFIKVGILLEATHSGAIRRIEALEDIIMSRTLAAAPEDPLRYLTQDPAFSYALSRLRQDLEEEIQANRGVLRSALSVGLDGLVTSRLDDYAAHLATGMTKYLLTAAGASASVVAGIGISAAVVFDIYASIHEAHEQAAQRVLRSTLDATLFGVSQDIVEQIKQNNYSGIPYESREILYQLTRLKYLNSRLYLTSQINSYGTENVEFLAIPIKLLVDALANAFTGGKVELAYIYYNDQLIRLSVDEAIVIENEPPAYTWYLDGDHDGYTDGTSFYGSVGGTGYYLYEDLLALDQDCDDEAAGVNPGAYDTCGDGIDQDCSGSDELCAVIWYEDQDGDGYTSGVTQFATTRPAGYISVFELASVSEEDCSDDLPSAYPGAAEVCGDGIDQDCDGADLECPAPLPAIPDGLTATAGADTIFLTWNAAPAATAYRIYWGTESGVTTGSEYGGETTDTAFLHTGVLPGWTYYYRVASVNAAGESDLSAEVSASPGMAAAYTDPVTGMEFVYVPPGTFTMGDEFGDGLSNEKPTHQVTLSQGFYLGTYEVTQTQWETVLGSNPSYFPGNPGHPVEWVSWDDVQTFISELNAANGNDGCVRGDPGCYYLPTEAQWEYAAKGGPGGTAALTRYAGSDVVDDVAWYLSNSGYTTQPVGTQAPNELGLYDMTGNVWEWVQDWFGSYRADAVTDPTGPASGSIRVRRGGSWDNRAMNIRVAYHAGSGPDYRGDNLGLRLARTTYEPVSL